MLSLLLIAATSASFAADRVATKVDVLPDRAATPAAPAAETPPEAPAAVAKIAPLLGARHTADLPDKAALAHHEGAEAALQWLAQYGDSLVQAERAAMLLATYDSAETAAVCRDLLSSPAHAKIRAGAAHCLASQTDAAAEPALVAVLSDTDVRVSVAAADALVVRPGAVDKLDATVVETLPEVVRSHLRPE